MPCITAAGQTAAQKQEKAEAVSKLNAAIGAGTVNVVIDRATGAVAFKGWKDEEKRGVSDICAYRALAAANSPELRRAVTKAQAMGGVMVNHRAIAGGMHSHDGGNTWGKH